MNYNKSLEMVNDLLKEIRKIDDKHLLVEIQILESRIYHSLENNSKAKSSLTAAKVCSNSIYCPPTLQA
jgi:26S proteasome regulatory subunit N6